MAAWEMHEWYRMSDELRYAEQGSCYENQWQGRNRRCNSKASEALARHYASA